tara:strand:+ start:507 stop:725 length:219 start_codon:yes stop_codon:yes gene_type:complete
LHFEQGFAGREVGFRALEQRRRFDGECGGPRSDSKVHEEEGVMDKIEAVLLGLGTAAGPLMTLVAMAMLIVG